MAVQTREPTQELPPQAALEQATAIRLREQFGWKERLCRRMLDGRPPADMGQYFISVWHDNSRRCEWRTAMLETYGISVTITVKHRLPHDRRVEERDLLERLANDVSSYIQTDAFDYRITHLAESLASFTDPPLPDNDDERPVGFREALAFEGMDALQIVGPEWFSAHRGGSPASSNEEGIAQRLRFGGNKRLRRMDFIA